MQGPEIPRPSVIACPSLFFLVHYVPSSHSKSAKVTYCVKVETLTKYYNTPFIK